MKHAIVVGSGLAGLTAGYRLGKAGWRVTVLEQADRICGRVITIEKDGYLIDACATSISTHYVSYIALLNELGLGAQLTHASNIFGVVRDGRVHYVNGLAPVRSFLGTGLMSWPEKLRFVSGALKLGRYMKGTTLADPGGSVCHDGLSIDDVVKDCFGPELTGSVMDPLMRVVTYGDVRDTTSVELFTGLVSASGRYVNVLGGLEALPRKLAESVEVRLRSPVVKIERQGAGVAVSYRDGANGSEVRIEKADACIVTAKFPDAAAMCPQIAREGAALARFDGKAESYVVHLGYAAPTTPNNPAAIALPRREFPNNPGIFLDHNKAPDRAPKGHSLFTVYYCPEAVALVRGWGDEKTVADASALLERFFPEVKGHLRMSNVKFAPYASHLAPPGYFAAIGEFNRNHAENDPIQLAGDYFSLPSQETAVHWGGRIAERVIRHLR
jgi:protoporphyrinogen oxidase